MNEFTKLCNNARRSPAVDLAASGKTNARATVQSYFGKGRQKASQQERPTVQDLSHSRIGVEDHFLRIGPVRPGPKQGLHGYHAAFHGAIYIKHQRGGPTSPIPILAVGPRPVLAVAPGPAYTKPSTASSRHWLDLSEHQKARLVALYRSSDSEANSDLTEGSTSMIFPSMC